MTNGLGPYNEFLDIMASYKIHQEEARTVVDMIYNRFQGSRPEIIQSFSYFLSPWLSFETLGHNLIPIMRVRSTMFY